MMRKKLAAVAALVAAFAVASPAEAQSGADKATARHLMDAADRLVEQKRLAEALRAYESAHAIMHVPTTGIEVARTLAAMGRLVEARQSAFEITQMPGLESESKPFAAARRAAADLEASLARRIPSIVIDPSGLDPTTLRATVDGAEVPAKALGLPQRVDPGRHVVRIEASGHAPSTREIDLAEGATETVPVEREGANADEPAPEPTSTATARSGGGLPPLAVGGIAVASAGFVIGAVTGLVSLDRASDARAACGPDTKNCEPAAERDIDASKAYGWVSTLCFGASLVGAAALGYALLSDRRAKSAHDPPRLGVHIGAGGALVRGAF
jgi:hypothetical protein